MSDDGLVLFDNEQKAAEGKEPKERKVESAPEAKRYMVFRLGEERFAIDITSTREVIEVPEFRAVPNTLDYFSGYFNLRGEVIGLIDLRKKFAYKTQSNPPKIAIVFAGSRGVLAAVVDNIERIVIYSADQIEKNPAIKSRINMEYLEGISKNADYDAIFINLHKIVTEDDWIKLKAVS